MFKCSMELVEVAGADLMKDGSADLRPSKLSDLPFNLKLISNASVFAEGRLKLEALRRVGLSCMQVA
jgi:hypothetical protein